MATMKMQFRDFGWIDWKVSALGFGCMRLPTTDGKPLSSKIDERESIRMIRHAIDQGVNYIDTAYPYHDGRSEIVLGKVLKNGYREKVKVATKSPMWLIKRQKDFDTYLNTQLRRLKTNHIEFYLLHGLNKKIWRDTVLKHNLLKRAENAVKDGKIGHIGFSFHDDYAAFKEIVDGYDGWEFCQIQYNYMDVTNQAGTKGLKYAASKGLAVVVMEPLLGGRLANPPAKIRKMLDGHDDKQSPADLALQWIWNQPEVSVILSGMNTMQQVKQNIKSARSSGIGSLDKRDLKFADQLRAKYKEEMPISCTKCGYCMPCPNEVDIPGNFELYNDGYIYDDVQTSRRTYERFMGKKQRASWCKQCGECEKKCPQKLPIMTLMPEVHSVLGEGMPY
jgi:hypothetical protein